MTPRKLRNTTLSELRKARKTMESSEVLTEVKRLSEAEQAAAGMTLLKVLLAIRELENTKLAEISQKLTEHEPELKQGICDLKAAAQTLSKIQAYLGALASLLGVVGKIVALV